MPRERLWRTLKSLLVASAGMWAAAIAFASVADYGASWAFLRHVLSLDAVFPERAVKYRAVADPDQQAVAYWSIIGVEWIIGGLCMIAAWRLFAARNDRRRFVAGKPIAAAGLALVFVLYAIGFVTPGGEWLSMWQSSVWNGQAKAAIFLGFAAVVLLVLLLPERRA
jgi:predicted small integral membrane protein